MVLNGRRAFLHAAGAELEIVARDPVVRLGVAVFAGIEQDGSEGAEGEAMVVFTGGIGENEGVARAMICQNLSWAGIGPPECLMDPARNRSGRQCACFAATGR